MKHINNIIKATCLGIVGVLATSCQDWLTIYPQTQIVEENFWEDKTDLEGVRYATYKNMCGTLQKMVLWGDLRSDSYSSPSYTEDMSTYNQYKTIREANISLDSADTYFDWGAFYTTINYCNKVLQHGPEVLARDKQFTNAEWQQMHAEITALRALNYFYLIRAFKDVPYSTKVINNDTQVQSFAATHQLVVLDSLITDCESVKGQARNRFSKKQDTKGLITNTAIYAMLSDMYLWRASLREGRYGKEATDSFTITNIPAKMGQLEQHSVLGDYQKAADYADEALRALTMQTEEEEKAAGFGHSRALKWNFGLEDCDMYMNDFSGFTDGKDPDMSAYDAIFVQGNSDESILELQFNKSDSRSNGVVNSVWGNSNSVQLIASQNSLNKITTKRNDSRLWFSANDKPNTESQGATMLHMLKWSGVKVVNPENGQKTVEEVKYDLRTDDNSYRNWIIYRMSDMMLQKAEALVQIGGKANENLAMKYVNAIHRRWYCNAEKTGDLKGLQPNDKTSVMDDNGSKPDGGNKLTLGNYPGTAALAKEIVVMNERQLEFMGEGKRWFDLVRYAERHAGGQPAASQADGDEREWTAENPVNNGVEGIKQMCETFLASEYTDGKHLTIQSRMQNRYGLYNLIYYKEIKASEGMLQQNPAWRAHK